MSKIYLSKDNERKSKKKKLLIPIISLTLLLSGCSNNNERTGLELQNTAVDIPTEAATETQEPKTPHFETYTEVYNYLTEEGTKLETFLKNNKVEYKKSTNNHLIMSKDTVYEMYDKKYGQYFEYDKKIDYVEKNGKINLEMNKQYHAQDEIIADDAYFKLFYGVAKVYDNTLIEKELLDEINEARINQQDITIYEAEEGVISFNTSETECEISATVNNEFTLGEIGTEGETTTYETVSDFKDKYNKYRVREDEYSTEEFAYNDVKIGNSLKNVGYRINYARIDTGELSETYMFDLMYDPSANIIVDEFGNRTIDIYMTIPKDVKETIPEFFDIINEHAEIDIRKYMTEEQFIGEIEYLMAVNRNVDENGYFRISDNGNLSLYTSPLPGNKQIGLYLYTEDIYEDLRAHEGIRIEIEKKVIAEGKSVL